MEQNKKSSKKDSRELNTNYYTDYFDKDELINSKLGVIGVDEAVFQVKSALLSNRHILIIGQPGIGKTTLAKNILKLLKPVEVVKGCPFKCLYYNPKCKFCLDKIKKGIKLEKEILKPDQRFVRIQGSPELTAEDLIGDINPTKALKYGVLSLEAFVPGKLFKANHGILFFDEINRASEKIQNILLQVLEEKSISLANYDFNFDLDLILIATMNPNDASTEDLSDVLKDRFDIVYMDFPKTILDEFRIIENKLNTDDLNFIDLDFIILVVGFVRFLRQSKEILKKPSVRSNIGLIKRIIANSIIKDKKAELSELLDSLFSVLLHRIELKPEFKYTIDKKEFIMNKLKEFLNLRDIKDSELSKIKNKEIFERNKDKLTDFNNLIKNLTKNYKGSDFL